MGKSAFFIALSILFFIHSPNADAFARHAHMGDGPIEQPLTPDELAQATDDLVAVLKATHYFDFVDSRIHGWPESDSRYPWWGTFWSGISLTKEKGLVTYTHNHAGSDNNGLRTAPYMEAACYAYLLWKNPKHAQLARKMLRGMNGWITSTAVNERDTQPKVLVRAFYPISVESHDAGRDIFFNYDASRPGAHNHSTDYVHLPDNPYFGDIYIKNGRSSDDMGHIIRALTLVEASCESEFGAAEFTEARSLYARWAEDVDRNGFTFTSIDSDGIYDPVRDGSRAYTHSFLGVNPFCVGTFAIRLLHSDSPGDMDCGSGLSWMEKMIHRLLQNDAREIVRTHQEAAVAIAKMRGLERQADRLKNGLKERVKRDLADAESENPPLRFNKDDVPMLLVASANVGVTLTPHEIRWLHRKLHHSFLHFSGADPAFQVFDPETPDGAYSYDPPDVSGNLYFRGIGMLLGSCASPYRDMSTPVLDCERLKHAFE